MMWGEEWASRIKTVKRVYDAETWTKSFRKVVKNENGGAEIILPAPAWPTWYGEVPGKVYRSVAEVLPWLTTL